MRCEIWGSTTGNAAAASEPKISVYFASAATTPSPSSTSGSSLSNELGLHFSPYQATFIQWARTADFHFTGFRRYLSAAILLKELCSCVLRAASRQAVWLHEMFERTTTLSLKVPFFRYPACVSLAYCTLTSLFVSCSSYLKL